LIFAGTAAAVPPKARGGRSFGLSFSANVSAIHSSAGEDIEAIFRQAGVRHVLTLGSTWISDQIRENKRLRMMVPRVYGLGDLSQILDERAYDQAKALLASMREDLSKVVITSAYRRAAEALTG
jgi:hypothetical protein